MDYSILMQVSKCFDYLPDIICCLSFSKESFLSEYIEQRRLAKLQNQINAFVLFVKLVKFETIFMFFLQHLKYILLNYSMFLYYSKQIIVIRKYSMKEQQQTTANIILEEKNYILKAWKDLNQSIFNVLYVLLDREDDEDQQQSIWGLAFESGLDYLQMLAFPFNSFIMNIWNGGQTLQSVSNLFSKLNIMSYLPGISFDAFLIVLYLLIFLIILVLIDIIYVSYSFSKKRFRFTWPLIILAKLVPLFVTVFFVPITQTLLSVVQCGASSNGEKYQVMQSFPDIICWQGWHLFHAAITLLFTSLFVFISTIVALALFQPRMASKKLTARQNSTGQIVFIVNKITCQLIFSFTPFEDQWVYAIMLFLLSGWLFWTYNMRDPFYNKKASKFFRIASSYYFWTNFMLLASQLLNSSGFNGGLVIWISGLPFIGIIIGFEHKSNIDQLFSFNLKFKSGQQLQGHLRYVLQLLQNLQQDKNSYMLITGYIQKHKQICVQDDCPLKMNKKLCKQSSQKQDLTQKFLLQIQRMYKTGIKKYPNCTKLRLSFAFFQLQQLKNKNKSYQQFSLALKTDPSFEQQFIIYRFKKIIRQNLQSSQKQENKTDLIQIIRFDNHISVCQQAMVNSARLHKDFWTQLKEQAPNLKKLNQIGTKITKTLNIVKQNYEQISKINSSVPQVLYCYSIYLLMVIKDISQGKKILQLSKKIYIQKINLHQKQSQKQSIDKIDVKSQQPMITVSCKQGIVGKILNLNSLFSQLSGYQRQQIVERNLQKILPQIYKDFHQKKVKQFLENQKQQQTNSSYINNNRHGYLKLKSGYILPIEYNVIYKSSAQFFTIIFKNQTKYRNCCHFILDRNKNIKDISILGYVYFGLDRWMLGEREFSFQQIFGISGIQQLEKRYKKKVFQENVRMNGKQIPCNMTITQILMQLKNQVDPSNTDEMLLGYYIRLSFQNGQIFNQLNNTKQVIHINSSSQNLYQDSQDVLDLYQDPNIYDILISNLADTKYITQQPIQYKLTQKIKTMRLVNNQIKMVYDKNNNMDFDNNKNQQFDEEDLQFIKLNDDRYHQKIRNAINTKLDHQQVSKLKYISIFMGLLLLGITIVEMLFGVLVLQQFAVRSQISNSIVHQSNQISKYITATLDPTTNLKELAYNISIHKININSQIKVNITLGQTVKQVNITHAFIYFYSVIAEYCKLDRHYNIDQIYVNYIQNMHPVLQNMNNLQGTTIRTKKQILYICFTLTAAIIVVYYVLWVYIRLKLDHKKSDILLWFLDIPISYVSYLNQNCDNYLKQFLSIKQVMQKGIKIQQNKQFIQYKQTKNKQQQIQQQQKARKSLILKQRKITFLSKFNLQYIKMIWIIFYALAFSFIMLSFLISLNSFQRFISGQAAYSGKSILWANSIHFSYYLIDNGKDNLNGINIYDFKSKNFNNFQNALSDDKLNAFNTQILQSKNPAYSSLISHYTAVYYKDICKYLNQQNSNCTTLVDSSLQGGYRIYTMYLRKNINNNIKKSQIRQANQNYASRAILQMWKVWNNQMQYQVQNSINTVSILFYVYVLLGMIAFIIIGLIYLNKLNNQINQAIRMLNMIPFQLLSKSRKQTRNFIVWIIKEANKKKHQIE